MDNYLDIFRKKAELQRDLKMESLPLGSSCVWLVYYESIVNIQESIAYIWHSEIMPADSYNDICTRLSGKEWSIKDVNDLQQGRLVVIDADGDRAFSFLGKLNELARSLDKPDNESMPFSPSIAFMEPMSTNIGLLRQAMNSPALVAEGLTFQGAVTTKEASLVYHADRVDPELLRQVRRSLQDASGKDVINAQDLIAIFGGNRFELLTPFYKTEIPIQAVTSMLGGRVILLVDGEPAAYVLPLLFCDFTSLAWDRQLPLILMYSIRYLRLLSMVIGLMIPGLYVALVSVNPETLRIELALSVASSRIGIPLPTFLEMLFLLIVSEISIESTQRLPKGIAGSITVIGGIVLGTAIVDAKLVSSLVIIVLSISVTAGFAFPNYINTLSIRLLRVAIVVLSGIFGVLGLFAGYIAICFYICSIERFGIPFMSFLDFRKLGKS